ncbi:MAG: hypothetical protein A2156_00800 [Deltaproteobacteria bacterium RBG_16_48_10]|nr:MAG: hypothetical protein A2156_00800 [Deltaproteobacteria bacterium RBG_16_48_10]
MPPSPPLLKGGRWDYQDCFGFRISKFGFRKSVLRLIFPFFFLFLFIIPMQSELKAEERPRLAILPFFIERLQDPARGAVCPVCKGVHRSGDIIPGAQNTVTRGLYGKMEALGTFKVLPLEKVEEALSKVDKGPFERSPIPSSLHLGKEMNADFVMVAILFRFEERIGSSLGVEKPASVAFDLHLFRLRDGARVWDGKFDETQKPLFDNLLQTGSFIRRKAQWLSAAELAEVGMEERLKKLPGPKELEEKP